MRDAARARAGSQPAADPDADADSHTHADAKPDPDAHRNRDRDALTVSHPGARHPAGSYAGGGLSFFVSNDIAHLQDITMNVTLTCTPASGNQTDQFVISEGTLAPNGTFDITATGTGLWPQLWPATYTYRFRGTITGTTATGSLTETIVYDDGVVRTCTTGERAFTASRTAQGTQTSPYPRPGSYTTSSGGLTRSLFVSRDGRQLQDVVAAANMWCTSQGGGSDELVFAEIPIQPDGSFSASRTVPGRWSSHVASITYSFSGHVHSVDAGGNDRLAGVYREIVNYTDGTAFTCDSNQRYWSATRDAQQAQTTAPPPPGSYVDNDDDIALYVSNDGTQLQDVSAEFTVPCAPSDSAAGYLALSELPIAADGSFGIVQVEHRPWRGKDATFTYTFRGHLHSVNAAGVDRLAGYQRVDMTFDDGSPTTCTTNDRYWLATRESQPTQTNAPPPAGRYSMGSDLSLFVSSDQTELQDVEFDAGMRCAPAALGDDFANNVMPLAEVPIAADGSFSTTVTRQGVFANEMATFTYRLSGHVHSVAPNGRARIAGQIREDVVAASGKRCSTGMLSWTATRDTQGTQTGTPVSGTYSSSGLSYTVSGGRIQTFATSVAQRCAPSGSFGDSFTVADLAIGPDGSFSVSGTRNRTVSGHPATITYSLSGNVHGVDSNGRWRMAGVLREDATYSDGATAYTCSTNDLYWSAVSAN